MPKYRFDQIAINSTAKKKPVEEDKDTYLGLEHLDPGTLKVTRFGSEVAPKGEKLLMKKGDVLFGKRRAYQKKVAIAPFDGIFSAHGMVLRPKEVVIDKDFFPMFISSDYFLDKAIAISVGSLSPTINWKDLAKLEFEIPELEEQKTIAKILWAAERTKVAYNDLLIKTDELVRAQFIDMFGAKGENPKGFKTISLAEVYKFQYGKGNKIPESKGDYPCYGSNGQVGFHTEYNSEDSPIVGHIGTAGTVVWAPGKHFVTYNGVICKKICSDVEDMYGFYQLKMQEFEKVALKGTSQPFISYEDLEKPIIPLPPIELQMHFANIIEQSNKSKYELQRTINELNSLKKKLISERLS